MKKLLVLVLSLGAVLGLSACGGEKSDITMWTGFGTSITTKLEEILAEFEEETGIKVSHETKGGYENLKQAAVYEMATGNTPTVILGYPDHFAEYIFGASLLPLDSFIAKEEADFLDDFVQAYLPENKSFGDGLIYGLPFNKSSEVLLYNKTFFDYYELEVPETWEDMATVCQEIVDIVKDIIDNKDGIVAEIGPDGKAGETIFDFTTVGKISNFVPFAYDSASNLFITTTRQWEGTYTQRGEDYKTGYVKFDNDETKAAMAFFDDMAAKGLFTLPSYWEESYASNAFKVLKCILTVGSSAGVTYNVPTGDAFEVGVAPIPYNGETGVKCVIQQGTNIGMMSNTTAEEREMAWELIKYLTSAEVNTDFAIGTGYVPVRTSALASDTYKNELLNYNGTDTNTKLKSATANVVLNYDELGYTPFVDDAFIGSASIRSYAEEMMDMFIVDTKTIDDALKATLALLKGFIDPNE